MKTFHLLISGKVQGVFFRESARKIAERLSLKGWVRNTSDEKVEAIVSGEEKELNEFIKWCKTGPERAVVKEVIVKQQPQIFFERFEIIRHIPPTTNH